MTIITRRSFLAAGSMLGAAQSVSDEFIDGRYPSRKTPVGLEPVEWIDIQPGDEIVVHDWANGRLVKVLAFTAATSPQVGVDGMPLESERFVEINCCRG